MIDCPCGWTWFPFSPPQNWTETTWPGGSPWISKTLVSTAATAAAAAAKSLQSCPTVQPHRRQPTRLPRPWDSPGKNTGVGCHFPLQCMKVKSESEVAQSCLTLSDPMACSLPGSSNHGIFQARVLFQRFKGYPSEARDIGQILYWHRLSTVLMGMIILQCKENLYSHHSIQKLTFCHICSIHVDKYMCTNGWIHIINIVYTCIIYSYILYTHYIYSYSIYIIICT